MGLNDGSVQIRASIGQVTSKSKDLKVAKEWIEALRFSPCGKFLAVGNHDQFIYIYDTNAYNQVGKV
jgi:WD40 repeat protein